VRRGNSGARALYGALGFVEIGVRPKYYADTGEDAVLMRLVLQP
jgi:ribosomal protein S18 acetylase RimI-like enzyme